METKNLLNKKITHWLLLVAMLVGCSASAWAGAIPSGTTIFLDFTNCDFTTNGYSSGVYVSVVGNSNAGKVADKGNTSGAASYAPNSESKWYTASKVGTSKIYKFTTTQEIGSNGFSVWSKNASNYNNCWEMNVRLCITDYNGANCYQFESGCTYHGDRHTNCYSGSWKKYVTGTIYYDNTNTKFSTCYNYIGRGNYTKCYTMERVSGTQYLWKKTYDFVDFTMWYVSSEKWWEQDYSDVYYYGGHTTKTVTMKYESPWTDGEVYKASSTLDYITDYGKNIQGYKWDSPAHSTVSNYTVTISNGTGGTTTVTDYDDDEVSSGASKIYLTVLKITVTPNSGYNIKKVTVGGTDYTSSAESGEFTYTVKAATTISVTYEKACAAPTQQTVSIAASTICSTSSTTISTTTSQSGYKYQLAKQNSENWDDVGDAVNGGSALSFTGINTAGTYKIYGYLSTDATCKSDMSNTVKLSVDATSAATSVSGEGAVCSDKTKTLTIASGYKGSLQWQKSDAEDGTYSNISGKTSTTYITTAGEAGWYRVSVKNGVCDAAYTTPVQVTVDAKPTLGAVSGAGAVCTGSTKTLTLNSHTQTINWQKSASQSGTYTTIPNTTGLTSYGATEAGWYRVQATNGVCTAVNNTGVQVTVDQPTVAGTITGAGDICSGDTKPLSSSGATATNYKWKSCLTEDGTYGDATGTINLSTYSAKPIVSTYYKLAVKNGECSWKYTEPVRVVVNNKPAQPGTISGNASPCINATGLTYSITAVATATGYTWTLPDGWSITSGAGTLSITATAGTAGGDIKVTADNDCGPSAVQTLPVTVKGKAITVSPTTVSAKKYTPTALTATTEGETVTWAVTGTNNYLLNADKTVYSNENVKQVTVKAVSGGNVTATTTNDGCETSATVTLSPTADTETCN